MKLKDIMTWRERCEANPEHNDGRIVTTGMIQARMQEEIDELTAALREAESRPGSQSAWAQMKLEREIERDAFRAALFRAQKAAKALRADFEIACTALCPHGLDIAAEKENMRRERDTLAALLKEAQYFVPSGILRDRIDAALDGEKGNE